MAEPGGLTGLRVIDASTVIAAPLVSGLMADFGADVVKIEQPGLGDPARVFEPTRDEQSLSFKVTNRNKRSITLDLRRREGADVLLQLVEDADVIVVNFRPAKLREWGIDWEDLSARNPRLIMLHLTAFGRTGPYADRPGFARIAESFAGLTYISGYADRPPVFSGYPLADGITGYYAAYAVMVAIEHRRRTGEGQLIDLALYEPVLRMLEDLVIAYDAEGLVKERMGNAQAHVVPNNVYPTRDGGFVVIPASTASMWRRLSHLLDDPGLAALDTNSKRLANRDQVDAAVEDFTRRHDLADLLDLLEDAGVAAAVVNDAADIVHDAHIAARANLIHVHDEELDTDLLMQAPVPRFSSIQGDVRWPGPALGRHTDEILRERVGLTTEQIAGLRAAGVV